MGGSGESGVIPFSARSPPELGITVPVNNTFMAQLQLPIFPEGVTQITTDLAFRREGSKVTYFYGTLPVFSHAPDDLRTFQMIVSQFYVNGHAKQAQIVQALGITSISLKRWVKRFQAGGASAFFEPKPRRGAAVLTAPTLKKAQELLDEGLEAKAVALQLGIKTNTFEKAVRHGRLHVLKKKNPKKLPQSRTRS